MENELRDFARQLSWQPEIINPSNLAKSDKFIVAGMGGSALSAGLLRAADPTLDLLLHRDYGLPRVPAYFLQGSLIILSSYSGNTQEVLDTAKLALERGLKLAVVTAGGELLRWAQEKDLPYVVLPAVSQPRLALGYGWQALAALMGNDNLAATLRLTAVTTPDLEAQGAELATKLAGTIPVIYSSAPNYPLAYQWKISINETGKTPSFANAFPELNHNEMQGYGSGGNFSFLFLQDADDDPRVSQRMSILQELYSKQNLPVRAITLEGTSKWERLIYSALLANWTAVALSKQQGIDPVTVPLIEEFKKRIA